VDESRQVFHAIVQWRWALLGAAVVSVLGALALADRRRRVLGGLAVGTAIATLAGLGGLTVVRSVAVDRAQASHVNSGISTATFNVLVRYARVDLYITLGIAVALCDRWALVPYPAAADLPVAVSRTAELPGKSKRVLAWAPNREGGYRP
jgi:hypothetical protein